MTELAEKPPISKMAVLFYALGLLACAPSILAAMMVSAMGGGSLFMILGFTPIVVFAIFAMTFSRFDKLHWEITNGTDYRKAGWSKIAILGYVFFAITLLSLVSYIVGFQQRFPNGANLDSVSFSLIRDVGKVVLPIAFLTMAHLAQRVREMTYVVEKQVAPDA